VPLDRKMIEIDALGASPHRQSLRLVGILRLRHCASRFGFQAPAGSQVAAAVNVMPVGQLCRDELWCESASTESCDAGVTQTCHHLQN
jgi:hypothetical protein